MFVFYIFWIVVRFSRIVMLLVVCILFICMVMLVGFCRCIVIWIWMEVVGLFFRGGILGSWIFLSDGGFMWKVLGIL